MLCAFKNSYLPDWMIRLELTILSLTILVTTEWYSYQCDISQITSSVKPDNVTLERNTTENNGCTDMWVNFTCKSSEANPPVHNYVLLRNETDVGVSEKGTWTEKISHGETFVYRCRAYQQVDNVTSTDNVTVTVNGKIKVCSTQTITFSEHCIANRSGIVCFCFSI